MAKAKKAAAPKAKKAAAPKAKKTAAPKQKKVDQLEPGTIGSSDGETVDCVPAE